MLLQDATLRINSAGWATSQGSLHCCCLHSHRLFMIATGDAHASNAVTCSLQEDWSLTADENWVSGFIGRSQPRSTEQLPLTILQTSVADQAPLHTKPISFARRSLQQAPQTYQATVAFTLFFTSQTTSSQASVAQDLSDALKQATAPFVTISTVVPVASPTAPTFNVSILFPPGNTVSATPSQGTLAAVTLTNALTLNPAQALPSLYAKHGAFQVVGTSIANALVPQGSPGSTQRASPLPASAFPNALPARSSPSATPPAAGQSPVPTLAASSSPFQTPPPPPRPSAPIGVAGLPSQVSVCQKCYCPLTAECMCCI